MRKRSAEMIGDNLEVALIFPLRGGSGDEVKMRPYRYTPDFGTQVLWLLESNETYYTINIRTTYHTGVYNQ